MSFRGSCFILSRRDVSRKLTDCVFCVAAVAGGINKRLKLEIKRRRSKSLIISGEHSRRRRRRRPCDVFPINNVGIKCRDVYRCQVGLFTRTIVKQRGYCHKIYEQRYVKYSPKSISGLIGQYQRYSHCNKRNV